ncbi:MAG: hypothetical protein H7Z17_01920 [Fuerstia sp.]|nr:hypothetical protein [Fuerstiella sp.]
MLHIRLEFHRICLHTQVGDVRRGLLGIAAICLACWVSTRCGVAQPTKIAIKVDVSRVVGRIQPLHGVNGGPLHSGETLDLSDAYRQLSLPLTRLHDCHWPNADVVDIHVLFPDPNADPELAASYNFSRTDDYIQTIVNTQSQIVFRLGESIEHSRKKYHVHPPADAGKWAAICLGIVRHYNDEWANGFRHNIRYWEIWNEPENRPAMWSGSDEDYFRIYAAAATAIKSRFPDVRVGGPAVGFAGKLDGDRLAPSQFVRSFLDRCRSDNLPLDFFSWHTYTNSPREFVQRARAIRRLLDESGFQRTENHLNEWNYLPDNDWSPMLGKQPQLRQSWFDRIHGNEGAAFTAASLIGFQDAPLDAANYYSADIHGFGMFSEHGVPHRNYDAIRLFAKMLATTERLDVSGNLPAAVSILAGINADRTQCHILASNHSSTSYELTVRLDSWSQNQEIEWQVESLEPSLKLTPASATTESLTIQLKAHSISFVHAE